MSNPTEAVEAVAEAIWHAARPRRECRRKHWRAWTTKTLGDDGQLVVCPICGSEPEEMVL